MKVQSINIIEPLARARKEFFDFIQLCSEKTFLTIGQSIHKTWEA